MTMKDAATQDKVLQLLLDSSLDSSISEAFFVQVGVTLGEAKGIDSVTNATTSASPAAVVDWASSWLILVDETVVRDGGGSLVALEGIIHVFAKSWMLCNDASERFPLLELLRQLSKSTRLRLIPVLMEQLVLNFTGQYKPAMAPILAHCVTHYGRDHDERLLALQYVLQATWNLTELDHHSTGLALWLLKALWYFVESLDCAPPPVYESSWNLITMCVHWMEELLHMMQENEEVLLAALRHNIPRLIRLCQSQSIPVTGILKPFDDASLILEKDVTLSLVTLAFSYSSITNNILNLLARAKAMDEESRTMAQALLSNFRTEYQESCAFLAKTLNQISLLDPRENITSKSGREPHLFDCFTDDDSDLLEFVALHGRFNETHDLFEYQQIEALLFGILLQERNREWSSRYWDRLLDRYPHLSVFLVPVAIDRMNKAYEGDAEELILELESLSRFVVDPHCAQLIWNLVGVDLMESHVPLNLRVFLIRLFPILMSVNKKLYRRVIAALSVCSQDRSVEVRFACVQTVTDLAEKDAIRDVSDVIGWLNAFLSEDPSESPMHLLIVRQSIMALRYLVLSEELDFDVVIKVLNKRLAPVTDLKSILSMKPAILETYSLLLGSGSITLSEAQIEGTGDFCMSHEVQSAIKTLLAIGEFSSEMLLDPDLISSLDQVYLKRVLLATMESLNSYNLGFLGIDEDHVNAYFQEMQNETEQLSLQHDSCYARILSMIEKSFRSIQKWVFSLEESTSLVQLTQKVILLEESALGSKLWGKTRTARNQSRVTTDSVLPLGLPGREKVRRLLIDGTPATPIALLLASEESGIVAVRDLGDSCAGISDPVMLAFTVHALLSATSRAIEERKHSLDVLVGDIRKWHEVFLGPDSMYLALSALVFSWTRIYGEGSSDPAVIDICRSILDAYTQQYFRNDDIGKICIGLSAAASLSSELFFSERIIALLKNSVRGFGGSPTYGAFHGLSSIFNKICDLMNTNQISDRDWALRTVSSISSFALEELASCFEGCSAISDFLSGLATGSLSIEKIDRLREYDPSTIPVLMTKQVEARSILLGSTTMVSRIPGYDRVAALGCFHFLNLLEWGCGKGFAMAPLLVECSREKIIAEKDYEGFFVDLESEFVDRFENCSFEVAEDIFYAACCGSPRVIPTPVRELLSRTDIPFGDDGDGIFMVAYASRILNLPFLGLGVYGTLSGIHPWATKSEITAFDKKLTEVISSSDSTKNEIYASLLLGLLSSARFSSESRRSCPAGEDKRFVEVEGSPMKLPTPLEGTALSLVQRCFLIPSQAVDGDHQKGLALTILKPMSLPDSFVPVFRKWLSSLSGDLRELFLELLVCQVKERRRVVFDGTAFTELLSEFILWDEEHSISDLTVLARFMGDFVTKLPSSKNEVVAARIWKDCAILLGKHDDTVTFCLESICKLLSCKSLSPKTLLWFKELVTRTIYVDLARSGAQFHSWLVTNAFVSCLECLSHSDLEATPLIDFHGGRNLLEEAFSVRLLLILISKEHFGDNGSQQIERVIRWIAYQIPNATDQRVQKVLLLSIHHYADTLKTSYQLRSHQLASILEALLQINDTGKEIGIEWLSVALSHWGVSRADDSVTQFSLTDSLSLFSIREKTLSRLTALSTRSLPHNASHFSHKAKSAILFNLIHRLEKRWERGKSILTLEDVLVRSVMCCRHHTSTEDTVSSTFSTALQKNEV